MTPSPKLPQRNTAMVAALLLDYPAEEDAGNFAAVRAELATLPSEVRPLVAKFLDWAQASGPLDLAEHYVETFDQRRRCSLYLSYFTSGDTRQRGAAIIRFADALRAAGWEVARDELPDYLPLICEFAARSNDPLAWDLLSANREGLEVLRAALENLDSPYRLIVAALLAVLPEMDAETTQRYLDLIRSGPPTELVGASSNADLPFPVHAIPSEV